MKKYIYLNVILAIILLFTITRLIGIFSADVNTVGSFFKEYYPDINIQDYDYIVLNFYIEIKPGDIQPDLLLKEYDNVHTEDLKLLPLIYIYNPNDVKKHSNLYPRVVEGPGSLINKLYPNKRLGSIIYNTNRDTTIAFYNFIINPTTLKEVLNEN